MTLPIGYKFKEISEVKRAQIIEASKKGSKALSDLAHQRRKDYNAAPKHCLECDAPLLVSLEDKRGSVFAAVKNRKFCNQSCGAKYNNRVLGYPGHKPKVRVCSKCEVKYIKPYDQGTRCPDCRLIPGESILGSRTKKESRIQEVRYHARWVLFRNKSRTCEICGYSVRVDCCHIKPVSEFLPTTLLSEINAKDNLIALCPNHHVELDLGLLKLIGA